MSTEQLKVRVLAEFSFGGTLQHEYDFPAPVGMPFGAPGMVAANGGDLAQERQVNIVSQSPQIIAEAL